MTIPVLDLGDLLVVSVQQALNDGAALQLKQDLLRDLTRTRSSGVVIDVSGVDIVDSFTARLLSETARSVRLLGADLVLVGLRPEIAMTMVELRLDLPSVLTALNLARGIELLQLRRPSGEGITKWTTGPCR